MLPVPAGKFIAWRANHHEVMQCPKSPDSVADDRSPLTMSVGPTLIVGETSIRRCLKGRLAGIKDSTVNNGTVRRC